MSTPITLSDGVITLDLPGDMVWHEHFGWSPVVQQVGYTLTGALVVETATKQAGRPITLSTGADFAWITKAVADQLLAWAEIPGKTFTLGAHGAVYSVMMRHDDPPAVEATLLAEGKNPLVAADWMRVTLKLMEI